MRYQALMVVQHEAFHVNRLNCPLILENVVPRQWWTAVRSDDRNDCSRRGYAVRCDLLCGCIGYASLAVASA